MHFTHVEATHHLLLGFTSALLFKPQRNAKQTAHRPVTPYTLLATIPPSHTRILPHNHKQITQALKAAKARILCLCLNSEKRAQRRVLPGSEASASSAVSFAWAQRKRSEAHTSETQPRMSHHDSSS